MNVKIYIASKTKYANRWLRLRARGWPITCSWLTRFESYDYAHLPDVAEQCVREASESDALILYAEPGDELRGAFMEAGAALASGVLVYLVNEGRWNEADLPDLLRHPLVRPVCCVEHALRYAVDHINLLEQIRSAAAPQTVFMNNINTQTMGDAFEHFRHRIIDPASPTPIGAGASPGEMAIPAGNVIPLRPYGQIVQFPSPENAVERGN